MAAMVRVDFTERSPVSVRLRSAGQFQGANWSSTWSPNRITEAKVDMDGILGRLLRAKVRGGDRAGRVQIAQRPSRPVEAGQRDHPPGDGVA
jgi:hypothetical protein